MPAAPVAALLVALAALLLAPAPALAHGPIDPAGSSYRARIAHVPAGMRARPVDGDLRLWLSVDPRLTVTVIDYRGAPYLRFAPDGVWVNENSSMYYLNQVPPITPSLSLGPGTAPSWHRVSAGHAYEWHDGRLHALAATVRASGSSFAGHWSVPLRVDGRAATISGGLYHRSDPSIVWFWPIVVVLACVAAALRLGRPALELRAARALGGVGLAAFAVASIGHQLHGRPNVSGGAIAVLAVELAFAAWAVRRLTRPRVHWLLLGAITLLTLWQGVSLVRALVDGWVLLAVPPALGRLAVATCLAAGGGLVALTVALAQRPAMRRARGEPPGPGEDDDDAGGKAGGKAGGERRGVDAPERAWETAG